MIREKKALAKKKAIAEKKALAEKKAMVETKVLAERAEDDAFKAEIAKLEREQQKREKTIAEAYVCSNSNSGAVRIPNVQACVNLADLVKSFHTSIYFQKSASIQPRTGLTKFATN